MGRMIDGGSLGWVVLAAFLGGCSCNSIPPRDVNIVAADGFEVVDPIQLDLMFIEEASRGELDAADTSAYFSPSSELRARYEAVSYRDTLIRGADTRRIPAEHDWWNSRPEGADGIYVLVQDRDGEMVNLDCSPDPITITIGPGAVNARFAEE